MTIRRTRPRPSEQPVAQAAPEALAQPEQYVKFSDKLTESLDDITGMINKHKGMIDGIQAVGIRLTDAFDTLHTLTVKYAGTVNSALDILLPVLKKFPIVPAQFLDLATRMERMTQSIIDSREETTKAIRAVNLGLRKGDIQGLSENAADLERVTKNLTAILPDLE